MEIQKNKSVTITLGVLLGISVIANGILGYLWYCEKMATAAVVTTSTTTSK